MSWKPYHLDHHAMLLVQSAIKRDPKSLNQAYKMRTTCAYGMERFWGEHLRLLQSNSQSDQYKGEFVADTWSDFWSLIHDISPDLAERLPKKIEIRVANEAINQRNERINQVVVNSAKLFWELDIADQRNCLSILSALCDAIVWWTQRLKPSNLD